MLEAVLYATITACGTFAASPGPHNAQFWVGLIGVTLATVKAKMSGGALGLLNEGKQIS